MKKKKLNSHDSQNKKSKITPKFQNIKLSLEILVKFIDDT